MRPWQHIWPSSLSLAHPQPFPMFNGKYELGQNTLSPGQNNVEKVTQFLQSFVEFWNMSGHLHTVLTALISAGLPPWL